MCDLLVVAKDGSVFGSTSGWCGTEAGDQRGGEWEPIKISFEIQPVGLYPKISQILKRSDQVLE